MTLEAREAHCFGKCRSRQLYTRLSGISRPVYTCGGCGGTREIVELGDQNLPTMRPVEAIAAELRERRPVFQQINTKPVVIKGAVPPVVGILRRRQQGFRRSLYRSIEKQITRRPAPMPQKAMTLEDQIRQIVREELEAAKPSSVDLSPEALKASLMALLGGSQPAKAKKAKGAADTEEPAWRKPGFECPRGKHMGRHGKPCLEAA